ncbi:H+ antiporter-2 family protein [Mycobacterium avium subsp. avium 2285 (R)]|nr:H+ antiporter-2 family protein [Mycobacterium avium subsp. avium 2285 (R)]
MMIGFFMIMVDSTIVAIANPTIMADLHIGYDTVVWVTSAYLLGYAVVLLVAGRLGDRFGTKNLYLIGLAVFTVASVWCGLAGSAAMLIAARVVQGVGAGVMTPQTLSTITRIFPAERRGVAVSVWSATAGAASLAGPLAGGVLVDGLGWQWIFFVNVPIGVLGLVLAYWLVPVLPTQSHRFDLVGVGLSGVGMLLIVFGLQQGQAAHWQPWIWALIVAGVGFVTVFVFWQSVNVREPLIPLVIFSDRDFSLCNIGVAIISFAATAMMLPLTFYAQAVCGLSPTRSALLIAPMAIANGVFAPFVGKIVDRYHPRPVLGFGFSLLAIALTWLTFEMSPATPIWRLVLPFFAMGVGMAFVWSPLTATATRNLSAQLAGAGSAVYNSVRQLGAVLGSAGMAAFMTWRIGAEMPGQPGGGVRTRPGRCCPSSCAGRSRRRCRSRCCCRRSSRCSGSSPRCSWWVFARGRTATAGPTRSGRTTTAATITTTTTTMTRTSNSSWCVNPNPRRSNAPGSRDGRSPPRHRPPTCAAVTPSSPGAACSTNGPLRFSRSASRTTGLTWTAASGCARWRCGARPNPARPPTGSPGRRAAITRPGGSPLGRRRVAARPAPPSRPGRRPHRLRPALVGQLAGQRRSGWVSARNAPSSISPAGVPGRYSVSVGDRTITAAYWARLTATLSRFLLSRKEIPRGTTSTDEAVIEMKTTGACPPWNLSTVPTRTPSSPAEPNRRRSSATWAL